MILRVLKNGFPRTWAKHPRNPGTLLETDIGTGFGKLRAKLVVFRTRKDLRAFWKELLGHELGAGAMGAVNGLYSEIIRPRKRKPDERFLRADPRYFCVIGLTKRALTMEIITHEAVHAAFAFSKRKTRNPWDCHAREFDEEAVCYPAGRIAAAINRALHAANLYPGQRA